MKLRMAEMWQVSRRPWRVLAGCVLAALLAGPVRGGVVAHWSFDVLDADGTFHDSVGNNAHPATPKEKAAVEVYTGNIPAPFGKAVSFSGDPNSFLTIPPVTNIQKSSFSVAAWVFCFTSGPNYVISDWPSSPQAGFIFGLEPLTNDRSQAGPVADLASSGAAQRNGNRTSLIRQVLPRAVALNEWHHMAWTWDHDGRSLKMYLDGTYIPPQGRLSTPRQSDLAAAGETMRIGSREMPRAGAPGPVNFSGLLDELWIFDEALTQDQIRNLVKVNDISGVSAPAIAATTKPAATTALTAAVAPTTTVAPAPAATSTVAETTKPAPVVAVTPAPAATTKPVPAVTGTPIPPAPAPMVTTPSLPPETAAVAAPDRGPPARPLTPAPDLIRNTRSNNPILGTTQNYSPARLAGIVACLTVIVAISCYLIWAMTERARMRATGRL